MRDRASIAVLALYFAIALLPNWFSRAGVHSAFFVYGLTVPVVLIALVAMAFRDSLRKISIAGLAIFATFFVCNMAYKRGLPQGSFIARFDRAAWNAPNTNLANGDLTPRQKMLGDVVRNVLPNRSRAEIEELLGRSDSLTYMLGPQRTLIAIEAEFLFIELDESGRFERYAVGYD